ncbi:unnamed protein product, partial [Ectocarpus sp. 12 AP-2014]
MDSSFRDKSGKILSFSISGANNIPAFSSQLISSDSMRFVQCITLVHPHGGITTYKQRFCVRVRRKVQCIDHGGTNISHMPPPAGAACVTCCSTCIAPSQNPAT